jgi:hypothetical protein
MASRWQNAQTPPEVAITLRRARPAPVIGCDPDFYLTPGGPELSPRPGAVTSEGEANGKTVLRPFFKNKRVFFFEKKNKKLS